MLLIAVFLTGCTGHSATNALIEADRAMRNAARAEALENSKTGAGINWHNPDSGTRGTVVPTRTFESSYGEDCREFQETVTAGQKTAAYIGTSCRGGDGTWTITRGPYRRDSAASGAYGPAWGYSARYGHFGYRDRARFGYGTYFGSW